MSSQCHPWHSQLFSLVIGSGTAEGLQYFYNLRINFIFSAVQLGNWVMQKISNYFYYCKKIGLHTYAVVPITTWPNSDLTIDWYISSLALLPGSYRIPILSPYLHHERIIISSLRSMFGLHWALSREAFHNPTHLRDMTSVATRDLLPANGISQKHTDIGWIVYT